jgi:ribulose-phosphate 3-epimerase
MQNDFVKLAPSILAADFARLGEQVTEAERAGADRIHVDVMDGHFVPNIAIGPPLVQSLRRTTPSADGNTFDDFQSGLLAGRVCRGRFDVISRPLGNNNLHRTVQRIKTLGKRAGVAINPATPASVLQEILLDLDQVLVMTVNPGFEHQHFQQSTLPTIRRCANDRADQARR